MASPIVIPITSTKFQLDKTIVVPGASVTVDIAASTAHDVVDAILANKPFPDRPDGKIELGSIELKAETGKSFAFNAGQTTVGFHASADFRSGLGVFSKASDAIDALQLQNAPQLNLSMAGSDTDKFLVLLWGYNVNGSFSGSHPIGVLGSVTFGADGAADSVYGVVHRVPGDTGAHTAISDVIGSWRLPRHVRTARDLKPATWLVAEVDGSLALQISAQLGYDLNLVREAKLLGMTRNLGAKIDAGLKASFGFDVSGRYLLVVGRESVDDSSNTVRLQLFKQSQKGLNFGLNLSVGITGQNELPSDIDDLVKAIFGVHGLQAVRDLHLIEQWTDPNIDLSKTAARLVNDTGLKLLREATGLDPAQEFNKARQIVLDALQKWDALPEKVSAATWKLLQNLGDGGQQFTTFLNALASNDRDTRAVAFANALQDTLFGDTPAGQWLGAVANQGVLALSDQLDMVQPIAAQTLDIINGGIIKKLQDFIDERLNLDAIRKAVTQADFDKLDAWLVKRLGDFFEKNLHFEDLKQVQAAINLFLSKARDIYAKAQKALNNRYNFEFAAAYMKNTTSTALLDVNFDLQKPAAAAMFRQVVDNSNLDDLFVRAADGVILNLATLSHDIQRSQSVQLNLPHFTFDSTHVNDSLAKITAEDHGGRVLVYELDANDSVTVKNRYRSELSVLASLELRNGQLELTPDSTRSISYQSRQVKKAMTLADFEHRVTPFVHEYLPQLFSGNQSSLQTFYVDLDRAVENVLHNGANQFGDAALAMQVSVPSSVLGSWFIRRSGDRLKADSMNMSRALQAKLRTLLPFFYFQEVSRLRSNPSAAALLVWAAMPVSTSIDLQNGQLRFNTDKDVYWNFPDVDLRRAVAMDTHTTASLVPYLLTAQTRLREAGDDHDASFFTAQEAGSFQNMTLSGMGDSLLQSLLFTEADVIRGAVSALKDVNGMLDSLATAPTKAINRFADFGADFTDTFNQRLSSVYGNDALRALSSMVLLEASRAIDPRFSSKPPEAMLNILTFTKGHTFDLNDFVVGEMPPRDQVAVAQTLVSLS
jgi:hypothetical protein